MSPSTPSSTSGQVHWHGLLPTPRLVHSALALGLLLLGARVLLNAQQTAWLALGLGCVWLGLAAWDAWRSLRALKRAQMQVHRHLPRAMAHGAPHRVQLSCQHQGPEAWQVSLFDGVDPDLDTTGLPISADVRQGVALQARYRVVPQRRGTVSFTPAWLRVRSLGGWWEFKGRGGADTSLQVFPNFAEVARYVWLAGDRRLSEIGIKQYASRGQGTDFHQLADYTRGDPVRHVDWKASLRRRKPVVRQYQDERDQTVMVLLDAGRRMRALEPGAPGSHFDQTLNATMLLAWVALKEGDQVGVLTFGQEEGGQRYIAPRKGLSSLNTLMAQLHDLEPGDTASDYLAAAKSLMAVQQRRALVIIITDFRDDDLPDLEPALSLLRSKHLVLLASLRERVTEEVAQQALTDTTTAAEVAAAHWQAQRREAAFKRLLARNHLMVDALPEQLAVAVVNRYHAIKRSHRL